MKTLIKSEKETLDIECLGDGVIHVQDVDVA